MRTENPLKEGKKKNLKSTKRVEKTNDNIKN